MMEIQSAYLDEVCNAVNAKNAVQNEVLTISLIVSDPRRLEVIVLHVARAREEQGPNGSAQL